MSLVFIGIGSNLGDKEANCREAAEKISLRGLKIKKSSSLHETAPWGLENQPNFINMVISAETDKKPLEVLSLLQEIEEEMGRKRAERWGPRIIDLDILLYDDLVLHEDKLVIPHPLMHKRLFVLKPLAEISSDLIHPLLSRRISDLLKELKTC